MREKNGVLNILTSQFHSTNREFRNCTSTNFVWSMLETCNHEIIRQWDWLEIRLKLFYQSTIGRKHFMDIIIILIIITATLKANIIENIISNTSLRIKKV